MYADDVSLVARGAGLSEALSAATAALGDISEWAKEKGVDFNPAKSNFCVYGKGAIAGTSAALMMGGRRIPYSPAPKLLGVRLDAELNFANHLTTVIEDVRRKTKALHALGQARVSASQKLLASVRNAFVHGKVNYALGVYGSRLSTTSTQQLDKVLCETARAATGLTTYARKELLHLETHSAPADKQVSKAAFLLREKHVRSPHDTMWAHETAWRQKHRDKLEGWAKGAGFTKIPPAPPRVTLQALADLNRRRHDLSGRILLAGAPHFTTDEEVAPDLARYKAVFFTDGSTDNREELDEGLSAYAHVRYNSSYEEVSARSYRAGRQSGPYVPEMLAIQSCLKLVKDTDGDVVIYTDSASSIEAIAGAPRDHYTASLQAALYDAAETTAGVVHIKHVAAHVGIKGNERADQAADWSRHYHNGVDSGPPAALTVDMLRTRARKKLKQAQAKEHAAAAPHTKGQPGLSASCKWYTQATAGKLPTPLQEPGRYCARVERTACKLRTTTSHLLGSFLHKAKLATSPQCKFCGAPTGDLQHVWLRCAGIRSRPTGLAMKDLTTAKGYDFICALVAQAEQQGMFDPPSPPAASEAPTTTTQTTTGQPPALISMGGSSGTPPANLTGAAAPP